jgi:hypothetical protein
MLEAPERVKGHCPSCGPGCWADVKGQSVQMHHDDENPVWAQETYRILQCRGCDTHYFQKILVFSEEWERRVLPGGEEVDHYPESISYWPAPSKREQPKWLWEIQGIDNNLHELLQSIYTALDADLPVLAAIAVRTALDRATELVGVDPAITFAEKLKALREEGRIGKQEEEDLSTLTKAGSAAAHSGWRPTPKQLDTMMATIEHFIYRTFFLAKENVYLAEKIPPRQKRRSKE